MAAAGPTAEGRSEGQPASGCGRYRGPATSEIYPLSLHDALPISRARADTPRVLRLSDLRRFLECPLQASARVLLDRKSTRLNSSHSSISYAVFCLKKKTS